MARPGCVAVRQNVSALKSVALLLFPLGALPGRTIQTLFRATLAGTRRCGFVDVSSPWCDVADKLSCSPCFVAPRHNVGDCLCCSLGRLAR
jgi:hypothetical protein